MKSKLLNIALILTSLIGYIEWGEGNQMFIFQGEIEIISKLLSDPISVLHPFTLVPLLGQILLLITLFQKRPSKILTYIGLGCIGILILLILLVGSLNLNIKAILSAMPFLIVGVLVVKHNLKKGEVH
ncbi:MAG TPA: hypothetical protein ENJ95_06725 [Bacteroidetes bacterium]|nr:hypothetical protein [Bacteroidota bacterium]